MASKEEKELWLDFAHDAASMYSRPKTSTTRTPSTTWLRSRPSTPTRCSTPTTSGGRRPRRSAAGSSKTTTRTNNATPQTTNPRKGPEDPRQRALDLIAKALDAGTSTEEGRTAAVLAVKHIDRYDLLSERKRHEVVQEAVNVVDTFTDVIDTIKESNVLDSLKKVGDQINQARRRR